MYSIALYSQPAWVSFLVYLKEVSYFYTMYISRLPLLRGIRSLMQGKTLHGDSRDAAQGSGVDEVLERI